MVLGVKFTAQGVMHGLFSTDGRRRALNNQRLRFSVRRRCLSRAREMKKNTAMYFKLYYAIKNYFAWNQFSM